MIKKTKTAWVRMPLSVWKRIHVHAGRLQVTASEWIRRAANEKLARDTKKK